MGGYAPSSDFGRRRIFFVWKKGRGLLAIKDCRKDRINACPGNFVSLCLALFRQEGKVMRRARNQKTRKSVAKRFKITATGKVFRNRSGKRHLLSCKNPKRRRRLGTAAMLDASDEGRIFLNLPFRRRVRKKPRSAKTQKT